MQKSRKRTRKPRRPPKPTKDVIALVREHAQWLRAHATKSRNKTDTKLAELAEQHLAIMEAQARGEPVPGPFQEAKAITPEPTPEPNEDCKKHRGRGGPVARARVDEIISNLPKNEVGKGRHKCPYCAYEEGYRRGYGDGYFSGEIDGRSNPYFR